MRAWTDYPLIETGTAPVREVEILAYDQNKYCYISVPSLDDRRFYVKQGYLYSRPYRTTGAKDPQRPDIPLHALYDLPLWIEDAPDEEDVSLCSP